MQWSDARYIFFFQFCVCKCVIFTLLKLLKHSEAIVTGHHLGLSTLFSSSDSLQSSNKKTSWGDWQWCMSVSPCRRIPVQLERDRLRSLHSISRKNVPFQCDFSSSAKQQTHRAHELHTRAFLHPKHSNMTRCRSTSPRHDSVQLVDEGHVEFFFFFFGQMSFFSSLGGNE